MRQFVKQFVQLSHSVNKVLLSVSISTFCLLLYHAWLNVNYQLPQVSLAYSNKQNDTDTLQSQYQIAHYVDSASEIHAHFWTQNW